MDTNGRYTKDDIDYDCTIETDNGLTITVRVEQEDDSTPPWEREDGHGSVSPWTSRKKEPGELVLATDRGSSRYYNFAEAVRIARKEWVSAGQRTVQPRAKEPTLPHWLITKDSACGVPMYGAMLGLS